MGEVILNGIWPEWEIIRKIGSGSFGVVYEAKKRDQLETRAAIKVISIPQNESELQTLFAEGMTEEASRTYMENVKNDFVSEIKLMNSFKAMQNIVSIEDYAVVQKRDRIGWDIFIRMELLTPFNTYVSTHDLSESEIIKVGTDICTALELCERNNVIHRDIKPENIFVNKYGDFKLGDFGIARKLENVSGGLSQKGSFNYMAPEVVKGSRYDNRVDIYSLGLVLYKLTNNNCLPFLNPKKQILTPGERSQATQRRLEGEPFEPPCNASKLLSDAIMCACSANPNLRFNTATAMKSALQYAEENIDVPDEQATQNLNNVSADGYPHLGNSHSFSDQWNGSSGMQNGGQWNNYGGYGFQSGGRWNSYGDGYPANKPRSYSESYDYGSGNSSNRYYDDYPYSNNDRNNQWKVFFAVFFGLLAVLVMILLFVSGRGTDSKPSESPDPTVSETVKPTETVAPPTPTETVYPTVSVSAGSTPTPVLTADPTNEINSLIKTFLNSFVYDVNHGSYNKLYSCVLPNSAMEKSQKEFIDDSIESGLEEELIEYTITSRKKVDNYTYHVTVIEKYEIWQYEEPEDQLVTQECTYKVCKQRDGTWLIEDFVGDMEIIERETLED